MLRQPVSLVPQLLNVLRQIHRPCNRAARRLVRSRTARLTRLIVERYWAPVGWGVAPAEETRFLARYLLTGSEGEAVARKIDTTVRRLPGLKGVRLLQRWMAREVAAA